MNRLVKIIRIVTIPPVLAAVMCTALYVYDGTQLGGLFQYIALIFFLSVLPALSYPLQPLLPSFKSKGRKGQRDLAFITSLIGYLCGIISALVTTAPTTVHIIYWSYLVSVLILTLINKATPWRASGHACGGAGPLSLMIYYFGLQALPLVLVFVLMAWASVRMKRHSLLEFVLGGFSSVTGLFLVLFIAHAFA